MLLKSNLNQAKNGPALANIFPVLNKNITEENFNTSILVEDDICGFKNHPFSIENGNPFFAHFFFRTVGGGGECRGRTRHFPECDRDNPHFQISGFFQLNSCGNETDEILLLLILVLLLLIDSSFRSNRAPAKVGSGDENFVRKKMIEKMESNLILRYKACLETLLVQQSHAHTVGQKEAKSFF